jgi:hypothetical protein
MRRRRRRCFRQCLRQNTRDPRALFGLMVTWAKRPWPRSCPWHRALARPPQYFGHGASALSLVALAGAGLFIHRLRNAQQIDPSFEVQDELVMFVNLGAAKYGRRQESICCAAAASMSTTTRTPLLQGLCRLAAKGATRRRKRHLAKRPNRHTILGTPCWVARTQSLSEPLSPHGPQPVHGRLRRVGVRRFALPQYAP